MDLGPASFSTQEWAAPPLSELEADGALSLTNRSTRHAADSRARRRSLPVVLTPLVGRGDQVRQVIELLEGEAGMVTLTGTGGVGKTRLALAVAAAMAEHAATEVCLVELAAISDPALVAAAVGAELGLREPSWGRGSIE